jgi:Flagellar protein FliT
MPHTFEMKPERRALAAYERLAAVTSRMREAAALEDWNAVMSLETECATLYADVLNGDSDCIGDLEYQQRKSELICKLLEDDADIRGRISGELTRIWRLIHGRDRIEQLTSTYSSSGGIDLERAARE